MWVAVVGFLAGATLVALGVGITLHLPPGVQLAALCTSLVLGGILAAALTSRIAGRGRIASMACTASGFAVGGTWFILLSAAEEGGMTELWAASSAGWAVAGLLVAFGFVRWDRSVWLLLFGPLVFGLAGAVSWPILLYVRATDAAIVSATTAAPALGGAVFGIVAVLLTSERARDLI
jgi:hypothetical protein